MFTRRLVMNLRPDSERSRAVSYTCWETKKAAAEEKVFNRRCGALFLSALLLAAVAASLFTVFRT